MNHLELTRRKFLKLLSQSVLTAGLASYFPKLAEAADTGSLPIMALRQVVTRQPAAARMIMWQSTTSLAGCRVEYRQTGQLDRLTQDAAMDSLTEDGATNYYYHALLDGLQPNTRYDYRVVQGSNATGWNHLTTPSAGDTGFTALIFCDSQCAESYADWQRNLQNAVARHPGCHWLANVGDLTDNGQSDWHWRSFFEAMSSIPASLPMVPVMGNHECYGLDWKFCQPTRYLKTFALPANGSSRLQGYYYSYDYGSVHFIVLNTQMLELADFQPGLLSEQLLWLHQDSKAHNKPWQVVLMHKDVLAYDEYQQGTKTTGGISDVGRAFMKAFDALGIDLVLTGHMHTYRNRGHIKDMKPATDGPVYIMSGPIGNEQYRVPADTAYDRTAIYQPTPENYLLLKSEKKELTITDYTANGELIETFTLSK